MINFPKILKWPQRPYNVYLYTKFEVVWVDENRGMGQRSWRIFYHVIWENGLLGILLLANIAAAI